MTSTPNTNLPPASPPQPAVAPHTSQPGAIKTDGVRDTIDSIVVALILAFVFRAFIVEAFVIPTGSMAPSLYGMHGQHRCPNCGYAFAYGIREPMVDPDNRNKFHPGTLHNSRGERQTFSVRCPNCTWDGHGNWLNGSEPVVPNSGDRILVLKWPYDIGGAMLGPKRWDVVVFKNPQDGEVNFIKRLLGLPGEVLQIIDGDLYAAPVQDVPADIVKALNESQPSEAYLSRLSIDQLKRLARVMKIQRKTRVAQDSLWLLHYDHDFVPEKRVPDAESRNFSPPYWQERDEAVRTWDASTPVVRFKPVDAAAHWLDLKGRPVEDEYGYNNVNFSRTAPTPPRAVGDVRLSFVLFPAGVEGELLLSLSKGNEKFQARIGARGDVRLEKFNHTIRDGFWEEIARRQIDPLQPGVPLEIEFENLDYRVALRLDGEEVLATTDAQYRPNIDQMLQQPYHDGLNPASISIGAQLLALDIRHLRVDRDTYYRSDNFTDGAHIDRPGWGTAMNPILLRESPQDFFCCGDNSPQSKDSRLWTDVCPMLLNREPPNEYRYGTVPGDQLIGQAFFVYWPSGLRFTRDTMAVIPNVGRMRLIR